MKFLLIAICSFILFQYVVSFIIPKDFLDDWRLKHEPDIFRNVSQLISSKGYPVEDHIVQTKDGYLLSMQRIPHGRNNSYAGKRPSILLQHGLLSAASDWVFNFPEQSLGFILADAGYDVWLGNTRGNTYSRKHVHLKPSMKAFWNYSFDEMAKYDLPAMIDYVLNTTGEKQLAYAGHSQGTTSAFALLSESPAYNEKIRLFIALAPVARVGHITSPIKYLAPFTSDLDFLFEILGENDLLPNGPLIKFLSEEVCDTEIKVICKDVLFLVEGFHEKHVNLTRIPVYIAHTPAGSSTKSVVHYGQLVNSKKFQKFDYGKHNKDAYNQTTPPEYDVSKITTPTALFWGSDDKLADEHDVSWLLKNLKSVVTEYLVPDPFFNHIDFVVAMQARELLYEEILILLKKYADVN